MGLEASAWKEKRLNDVLPNLQVEFQRMVQAGNLPELDQNHLRQWVKDAVAAANRPKLDEAPDESDS